MADVYLRQGESTPSDVRLREGKGYLTGSSTGSQAAQSGSGSGVLAFVGTGSGDQARQAGDGIGHLWFLGSGVGDQAKQTGSGTGTVGASAPVVPVIPASPEHLWGEWVDVRKLILEKARELQTTQARALVSGGGEGDQVAQSGSGAGHVMARISGASIGAQMRQAGRSGGRVSMAAKNERELRELLLLEAA